MPAPDMVELEHRIVKGGKLARNRIIKQFFNGRMDRVNTDLRKAKAAGDKKKAQYFEKIRNQTLIKAGKYNLKNYNS